MKENRLKTTGFVTALLLTIIFFAQCKKDSQLLPSNSVDTFASTSAPASTSTFEQGTLDKKTIIKDSGFAYYLERKFIIPGDSESSPTSSTLKLFENGKELGPAHTSHKDIRVYGKGRFSHWGNSLYFSSSDNTDPRKNGRRYTFTIGTVSGVISPITAPITTAPISTDKPIGYAMVDGLTIGGQGGQTVTVTNLTDFKAAAKSTSPLIIMVSGNFTGTGMIDVMSNKTIIGVNGATLNGVGLALYRVNNIIIKNLKINKVIGGDGITIKETSHHIWVDHCEIWQDRNNGWDYYDELLEVTDRSNYVTISNNKFHDSHIAFLIGSGDLQTTDIGYLKVTMYGNYFYNISERQPSTRFGFMHVFNNYFYNGSGYTIGATMGATVRTDNNYFENQANPIYTEYNAKPGYVSGASTNFYKNSGSNKISTAASNWIPPYEYQSMLIPAADVATKVMAEAGPKY
ncbi:polysaccharide lyase family 1 protein [Daejeonella sp.]|jgi:pectate lyase|uniref:polysaccharide lyase family 1 protein n=1 Tax=Daejeonella sp. TaxID=2805397 RepID=UPI0037C14824